MLRTWNVRILKRILPSGREGIRFKTKSLVDEVVAFTDRQVDENTWKDALKNIFVFIRNFVPKEFFDLDKANPQQLKILLAVNAGKRNIIIRAPRKGGKTVLVAIIIVWLCLKFDRYRVFVLSGSLEQAKWLYRYCRDIVTGSKKLNSMLLQEPTKVLTEFKNRSFIICSPASSKQVNAPTVDCLVMDEYVLIPVEIVVEAWPMVRSSPDPRRYILSTATEKVGLDSFLDIFDRAEELGFEPFYWSDEQCSWLSQEDSKAAANILSEEDYRVQYKGGVPMKKGAIFSKILIGRAFKKINSLEDLKAWEPKGPIKVGVDWGFSHDTVFVAGWLGLDQELHPFRIMVTKKTDDEELAETALGWDLEFYEKYNQRVDEWICDAAGAFQNGMMRKKGLWVRERAFGNAQKGKQWMMSSTNWFLEKEKVSIPDLENTPFNVPEINDFILLKKQLKAYRRDRDGNPIKGFDHCVDGFLCLCSGWDPTAEIEEKETRVQRQRRDIIIDRESKDWENPMKVSDEMWRPDGWRKEPRWPWETGSD